MFAVGMPTDRASAAAIESRLALLVRTLRPHQAGLYWNFAEAPTDPSRFFDEPTHQRLRALKAQCDPHQLFHANHQILPAA